MGKGGTIVGEGGCSWAREGRLWAREDVRGRGRDEKRKEKEREEIVRGDRLQRQDATPQKVGRLAGSGKIFPQGDGAALELLAYFNATGSIETRLTKNPDP